MHHFKWFWSLLDGLIRSAHGPFYGGLTHDLQSWCFLGHDDRSCCYGLVAVENQWWISTLWSGIDRGFGGSSTCEACAERFDSLTLKG
ncbi:MAG: hypothetical protein CMN94_07255 [Synechococcus sp. EAC657]|nr:hypothetical protein [Synechococcus sp. EAC657]